MLLELQPRILWTLPPLTNNTVEGQTPPNNMMRVVLFSFNILLFAPHYFRDEVQIPSPSSLCPPCDIEKMEQNNLDTEEARDRGEFIW